MKYFLTTTALGLSLAVTPALAQEKPNPETPDTRSMRTETHELKRDMRAPNEPAGKDAAFLKSQEADDQLASNLMGKTVYNGSDEAIGEITDLLTTRDGRIAAAIVETGSVLGIGGKDVAVAYESFQFGRDDNNEIQVTLNVGGQMLESAPEFQTLAERETASSGYGSEERKQNNEQEQMKPEQNKPQTR